MESQLEMLVPMIDPATVSWNLSIVFDDLWKLEGGYLGTDMDSHWNILVQMPAQEGDNMVVTLCRSWTKMPHFVLSIKPLPDEEGGMIETFTWEQNQGGLYVSEESAKASAVYLCRTMLMCEFNNLPHYKDSVLWDLPTIEEAQASKLESKKKESE